MARRRVRWLNAAVARYPVNPAAVRAFGRPATHSAADGEPPLPHQGCRILPNYRSALLPSRVPAR